MNEEKLRKKIAELVFNYKYSDDTPTAELVADDIIAEIEKH